MMLAALLGLALAAEPGPPPVTPELAYVTALDAYQQAELALHQGRLDAARTYLRQALVARDQAVAGYRPRRDDPVIRRRLTELTALDRPCCGKPSLAIRLSVSP